VLMANSVQDITFSLNSLNHPSFRSCFRSDFSTVGHLAPVEKYVDEKDGGSSEAGPGDWRRIAEAGEFFPKAMFLSWLTLVGVTKCASASESALSSQNVRFAHNPKQGNPHR
jgi:hypothetical protein